jgi:hypothetical protein
MRYCEIADAFDKKHKNNAESRYLIDSDKKIIDYIVFQSQQEIHQHFRDILPSIQLRVTGRVRKMFLTD